ncbi:GntR family transcriptional regulator [Gracilibacillus sp. JCM 18860]|uniref:FadR/GntR family transcriptional regulator n=1 Tax=Gracilibacillus sp. JCM 18860 TaxID=1306159 RepID=UPI000AB428DD
MKVKKQSLVDVVIEKIKKSIIDNNLKPNDKFLSEGGELVEQLQVSRTVIREALISLQALGGILKVKAGAGGFLLQIQNSMPLLLF